MEITVSASYNQTGVGTCQRTLVSVNSFVQGHPGSARMIDTLLALCELRHARSVIQILTSRRREARLWRRRWLA